ncbi:hypothetical protein [uncultured Maribacter sp.]|uniref:hypothetical protein n=1 Tax=uncultured Maribacter sp. TaxID=431308 RepID=UPI00260F76DA|nr:hypothetical protein [uncultured Maribacter sp.]
MEVQQKLKLQRLGGVLALFGLGSIILSFFDYNFILLVWMDFFGPTLAWILRISLVIIGAVLYFKYDLDDAEVFPEDYDDEME